MIDLEQILQAIASSRSKTSTNSQETAEKLGAKLLDVELLLSLTPSFNGGLESGRFMSQTLTAVFDGDVLRPDSPLNLEPNTRYVITIQSVEQPVTLENAWDVLEAMTGTVEAPRDWSSEHDHYLYGTPKRQSHGSE